MPLCNCSNSFGKLFGVGDLPRADHHDDHVLVQTRLTRRAVRVDLGDKKTTAKFAVREPPRRPPVSGRTVNPR